MIELSLLNYATLFIFIFIAGFIDAIAGGGGLITVPTYIMLGVPNSLILGTNKCVSTVGTTLSIFRYIKNRKIFLKKMLPAIILSSLGAFIGANLSHVLTNRLMVYIIIILVPLLLILEFLKKRKSQKREQEPLTGFLLKSSLIGISIGFYDGFFGPGAGTFFILALMGILQFDILEASTNSRILNYSSNVAAFIYFSSQMQVAWMLTPVAIIASLAGNYLGSGIVISGNRKITTLLLYLVLLGLIGKILFF